MGILVETSARHVHLTQKTLEILFGEGAKLNNRRDLSQPGQFVSFERDIIGPKGEIKNVSILGPVRSADQVEISLSDARKLGISALVRESGDIAGTPGCKLVGPAGELEISCGVIAAQRHIHLTAKDAEEFGVKDKQIVNVKVKTENRSLIFGDVVCRVRDDFAPAMHIDTDESNAAGISGEIYGEIIA